MGFALARCLTAIIAFAAGCGYAFAMQPFEGRWAEDRSWCSRTGPDAPFDERPITITASEIELYVLSCRTRAVKKAGKHFELRAICSEEGEDGPATEATFVLTVRADRLTITGDVGPWTLYRCSR